MDHSQRFFNLKISAITILLKPFPEPLPDQIASMICLSACTFIEKEMNGLLSIALNLATLFHVLQESCRGNVETSLFRELTERSLTKRFLRRDLSFWKSISCTSSWLTQQELMGTEAEDTWTRKSDLP
jgi:hypothetical protein